MKERQPGDVAELKRRASVKTHALQHDRYRAVLLALDGKEAVEIALAFGPLAAQRMILRHQRRPSTEVVQLTLTVWQQQ